MLLFIVKWLISKCYNLKSNHLKAVLLPPLFIQIRTWATPHVEKETFQSNTLIGALARCGHVRKHKNPDESI